MNHKHDSPRTGAGDLCARQGEFFHINMLLQHGAFEQARAVFELGCGTGALAEELLSHYLPPQATYTAVDISPVMVELSRRRLLPFGERARVFETDGMLDFSRYTTRCDRFVAVYVLDLLSPEAIRQLLDQACTLLDHQGKLCLVTLTGGCTPLSRAVIRLWQGVRRISPSLVGGCRPLRISPYLSSECWQIECDQTVCAAGVPSEVVVAVQKKTGRALEIHTRSTAIHDPVHLTHHHPAHQDETNDAQQRHHQCRQQGAAETVDLEVLHYRRRQPQGEGVDD